MKELIEIQSRLKAPKNQYNEFGKYNYRNAEDIMEAVKPILKELGCSLIVSDRIEHIGDRYYIVATARVKNSSGETEEAIAYAREGDEGRNGMNPAQVSGSTSSYARKYALNGLFCIDDNKDPDATNTHDENHDKNAQSAAQPAEIDIKKAEAEIIACKDGKTLSAVWGRYKNLPNNAEVEKIVKAQMEKLGITSNGNKAK
jgi:hypothetical protein